MGKKRKKSISNLALTRGMNGVLSRGMSNLTMEGHELLALSMRKSHWLQDLAIGYLIERVFLSARNCSKLHYSFPRESAQDLASISRGMYESAVNALYLLNDNDFKRLASFWKLSVKEERAYDNHLSKWCESDSDDIAIAARSEREVRVATPDKEENKILKELGICIDEVERWPSLKFRAEASGSIWFYFYDVRYRAYSTWQHGDLSRAIFSPSLSLNAPNMKDRSQSEGISILSWCHEVLFQFVLSLNSIVGDASRKSHLESIHNYTNKEALPYILAWRNEHPTDVDVGVGAE